MNKIPKYNFKKISNPEFEITSFASIFQKSKSKLIIPQRQDFFCIFYYTKNFGKHFVDFKEYQIKKGSLLIISNEQVHYFKNIDKTDGRVVLFTNSFLSNDDLIESIFEQNIEFPQLSFTNNMVQKFETLFTLIENEYKSDNKVKNEILLLEIFQISQHKNDFVLNNANYQRFVQFKKDLKVNYKSQKNVKFYADKQFTTPKTLNVAVRQTVDKSAKEYINEYIVLLAKRILINTNSTSKGGCL